MLLFKVYALVGTSKRRINTTFCKSQTTLDSIWVVTSITHNE